MICHTKYCKYNSNDEDNRCIINEKDGVIINEDGICETKKTKG